MYTSDEDRKQLEDWADGKCIYCGHPGSIVEHVLPVSKTGPNFIDNKVLACRRCNAEKRDGLDMEWLTRGFAHIIKRGGDPSWTKDWGKDGRYKAPGFAQKRRKPRSSPVVRNRPAMRVSRQQRRLDPPPSRSGQSLGRGWYWL